MRDLLKILRPGASTFPLLLIGLLIALSIFLRKRTTSRQMEYDLLIQKILIDQGFSPRTALFFAGVARHESGNYSSPLFNNHKNFFGMRVAKKRPHCQDYETPHEDPKKRYAGFNTPANSVRDIVLYLTYSAAPRNFYSVVDLATWMKGKGYFEADLQEYITGVERGVQRVLTANN